MNHCILYLTIISPTHRTNEVSIPEEQVEDENFNFIYPSLTNIQQSLIRRNNNLINDFGRTQFQHLDFNSNLKKSGKFVFFTYKKLRESNLVISGFLYYAEFHLLIKEIFSLYYENIRVERQNPSMMFKQTKEFINCLPNLKSIYKYVKKSHMQYVRKHLHNILFIKLCLDVYYDFYLYFDGPLFKNYTNRLIPLCKKFYNSLSSFSFDFIKENEEKINLKIISKCIIK
jgi:hypothetical protein